MERVEKECVYCIMAFLHEVQCRNTVLQHHKLRKEWLQFGPFPVKDVHVCILVLPFHSVVPMDLDVKMKAVMLGATFLIVSQYLLVISHSH